MFSCATCGGVWAAEASVRRRWENVTGAPPLPVLSRRVDRLRRLPCAACGTPMEKVMLGAIELDRCDPHGVWFDAGELERVVSAAELAAGLTAPEPSERRIPRLPRAEMGPATPFEGPAWPNDRDEFEREVTARLHLIELDLAAGDTQAAEAGMRIAIANLEQALQLWPDAKSLELRTTELRAALAALVRRGPPA
jgi:Zn-finger nucleic acid-binding protein